MLSASIMADPSAAGHGTNVGTRKTQSGTRMAKHILQYYWQEAIMYPYRKSKAWYFGPKLDWMKEVKNDKRKIRKLRKDVK